MCSIGLHIAKIIDAHRSTTARPTRYTCSVLIAAPRVQDACNAVSAHAHTIGTGPLFLFQRPGYCSRRRMKTRLMISTQKKRKASRLIKIQISVGGNTPPVGLRFLIPRIVETSCFCFCFFPPAIAVQGGRAFDLELGL